MSAPAPGTAGPDLGQILEHEVHPKLTAEQVFTHPAHAWHMQSAYKWQGACPRHESKSGSSFSVDPESLLWNCAGCGVGGGPIQYLRFIRNHALTDLSPTGPDFVEAVKELCELAGVTFPEQELTDEEKERCRAAEAR